MLKHSKKGTFDQCKTPCVDNNKPVNSPFVHSSKKRDLHMVGVKVLHKNHKYTSIRKHSSVNREPKLPSTVFQLPVHNKFQTLCDLDVENEVVSQPKFEKLCQIKSVAERTKRLCKQTVIQNGKTDIGKKPSSPIVETTKYELSIMTMAKKREKIQKARLLHSNKLFFKQNKGQFGFIPLSPLPEKIVDNPNSSKMDIFKAHELLKRQACRTNQIIWAYKFPSKVTSTQTNSLSICTITGIGRSRIL